jgi:hypothetical protein
VPWVDRDGVSTFSDLERMLWEAQMHPVKPVGWIHRISFFCVDRLFVPAVLPPPEESFLVRCIAADRRHIRERDSGGE